MTADGMKLLDPAIYAKAGPPHEFFTELRRNDPVARFEIPGLEPFWAIVKHADICSISKQPNLFLSGPGIVLNPADGIPEGEETLDHMRVVINMDPPEHRKVRKVASPWFTPKALQTIDAAVEDSAKQLIDTLAASSDGQADMATEIAVKHPLRILSTALGVPQDQEAQILNLSNRLFAPEDEEIGGGFEPEDVAQLGKEFVELFLPIIQNRRDHPTTDLASVLANGQIDGEPMGPMETLGYYLIVFNAGHDTTKNALAGGIRALVEHPEQFDKLRHDRSLIPGAVEEILRWTSSVNYMKRTAARGATVHGVNIPKGEALVMFYGSANRDEDIFDDPFTFNIERKPNPHIAFGYGEHFCMGAHFARRSMAAILHQLVSRIEAWELAGEPEWIRAGFVVGLKHLPVRYRIAQ